MSYYKLPSNPNQRIQIWEEQLQRLDKAERMTTVDDIELKKIIIELEMRMVMTPNPQKLCEERSLLHKKELENKMKFHCIRSQRAKLKQAINSNP